VCMFMLMGLLVCHTKRPWCVRYVLGPDVS